MTVREAFLQGIAEARKGDAGPLIFPKTISYTPNQMRVANINVSKIDKSALFSGKKGTYLDLVFHDNKEGRDQYGNDGFVTQGIPKERRDAGERGEILGNWKNLETGGSSTGGTTGQEEETIPF